MADGTEDRRAKAKSQVPNPKERSQRPDSICVLCAIWYVVAAPPRQAICAICGSMPWGGSATLGADCQCQAQKCRKWRGKPCRFSRSQFFSAGFEMPSVDAVVHFPRPPRDHLRLWLPLSSPAVRLITPRFISANAARSASQPASSIASTNHPPRMSTIKLQLTVAPNDGSNDNKLIDPAGGDICFQEHRKGGA